MKARFLLPATLLCLSAAGMSHAAVLKKPVAAAAKKQAAKVQTVVKKVAASTKKPVRPTALAMRRQNAPTPERYQEIQQALASRGYLTAQPTGVWDSESQDAMKRFQMDKQLQPSGKLTAASLIGLGLGSKTAAPLPVDATPEILPEPTLPPAPPEFSSNPRQ